MRILHTSDWHLGKRLFKLDRTEEHEQFLEWLVETLIEKQIDLLLIAGDIFDSPTPPHYSLEIFYNFLHRISVETKTQTLIIAGNHDSGLLLEAPSKILSFHRVKVWGKLSTKIEDHWCRIGNIDVCAIPFFRSYELMPQGEEDALVALNKYLNKDKDRPQILMLHHLAGIFEASGSEQVISLSGVDSIPKKSFEQFDYVALGHIHKPQKIASNAYYSGSPIPMRFSETQKKSVVIIEEINGQLKSETMNIPVFRELYSIKTTKEKYIADIEALNPSSKLKPIAEVQIQLDAPTVGIIDDIKERLQEKGIELLSYFPAYTTGEKLIRDTKKIYALSPEELFEEYYAVKFPESAHIPEDLKVDFKNLLEEVKHAPDSN